MCALRTWSNCSKSWLRAVERVKARPTGRAAAAPAFSSRRPDPGRPDHHGGRIEHDDEDQPAQDFERHLLDDEGGDEHRGDAADGEAEHDPRSTWPMAMWRTLAPSAHQRAAGRHDRKAEPRVHAHQAQHHQGRRIIADPEIGEDAEAEAGEDGDDRQRRAAGRTRSRRRGTGGGWSSHRPRRRARGRSRRSSWTIQTRARATKGTPTSPPMKTRDGAAEQQQRIDQHAEQDEEDDALGHRRRGQADEQVGGISRSGTIRRNLSQAVVGRERADAERVEEVDDGAEADAPRGSARRAGRSARAPSAKA